MSANDNTFRVDDFDGIQTADSGRLDGDIAKDSENRYISLVSKIVDISKEQLDCQRNNKQSFRKFFGWFFGIFLSVQYIALIVIMIKNATCTSFSISDDLIKTYIVSAFVETLGVVAVMVRFAFDTKQEVEILSTLNGIVEHFQKYKR